MAADDRVLPGLLDRLGHESGSLTGFSAATLRHYQQSVLRDLRWLLNARAGLSEEDATEFPAVARSVLNFGTHDFTGTAVSSIDIMGVERELMEAIQNFEPRIIPRTLSVKAVPAKSGSSSLNIVAFEIRAEVWATPFPEQVFIRTELDLETGQYALQ